MTHTMRRCILHMPLCCIWQSVNRASRRQMFSVLRTPKANSDSLPMSMFKLHIRAPLLTIRPSRSTSFHTLNGMLFHVHSLFPGLQRRSVGAIARYKDAPKAVVSEPVFTEKVDNGGTASTHFVTEVHTSDSGWMIRLANENSYLSWCRNTYLSTVLGVAMMAEATGPMMQVAGECALGMAALILTIGSCSFIHTIFVLRSRLHMSNLGLLIHIGWSLMHMIAWLCLMVVYIGYIDDEDIHTQIDDI